MTVRLLQGPDGALMLAAGERLEGPVRVRRAAPLSDPDRYLSIVDARDDEVAVIRDLADVDGDTRALVRDALARAYPVQALRRLTSLRTENGVACLGAETDAGSCTILVPDAYEQVRQFGQRVVISDVEGHRFEIADLGRLDRRSARLLARVRLG